MRFQAKLIGSYHATVFRPAAVLLSTTVLISAHSGAAPGFV
ncbi:MAG: hypothetical protein AVDCRST_MAG39-2716 [uncultured Sphingomonadaceae bacterium]|uniref:Uncharacterized protein n=1 Tax=uncultured Sphingomonadaceae bacterium TaxID=169976 RepID=A0A6J4TJ80_9SPHN|nr:MAG: hypothetical protein AVDCRST_MAG39-2716 [uncultured Sphingomonadaceae bacterium]